MPIPKQIGSLIKVKVGDQILKRELERQGFFMQEATSQCYVMRRDYADGVLKTTRP
jgi:hypothetical protein